MQIKCIRNWSLLILSFVTLFASNDMHTITTEQMVSKIVGLKSYYVGHESWGGNYVLDENLLSKYETNAMLELVSIQSIVLASINSSSFIESVKKELTDLDINLSERINDINVQIERYRTNQLSIKLTGRAVEPWFGSSLGLGVCAFYVSLLSRFRFSSICTLPSLSIVTRDFPIFIIPAVFVGAVMSASMIFASVQNKKASIMRDSTNNLIKYRMTLLKIKDRIVEVIQVIDGAKSIPIKN